MGEEFDRKSYADVLMARSNEAKRRHQRSVYATRWFILWTMLVSVLIWTVFGLLPALWVSYGSKDRGERLGVFGDSFGGINSLFTGLAFAGVASALYLQRRDSLASIQGLAVERSEDRRDRLLDLEIRARGSLAIALATRGNVRSGSRDESDVLLIDKAIGSLNESLVEIQQLRLAHALSHSVLIGDPLATSFYHDRAS